MRTAVLSKAWLALTLPGIAVVCGINITEMTRRVAPPERSADGQSIDRVARTERRFARLRGVVIKQGIQGVVGYVADLPPGELAANGPAMEDYFLAQFALVPCVLDPRAGGCEWVVANFRSRDAPAVPLPGYRTVEDLGEGVLLLRKGGP